MNSIIDNHQNDFIKVIDHFKTEILTIKTGRANPAILDNIKVEAYGVMSPLNQVAGISVSDARTLLITPWDKGLVKVIEKAILESDLKLNPTNDGDKLRINLPALTEESRKEMVKLLSHKAEEARIALRLVRDKIKDEILEAEKNKEFGEDEKFSLLENLDKETSKYNDEIKVITTKKEEEVMTI